MTQDIATFYALRPGAATRLDASRATLTVRDAGLLHVPSGVVEVCDPLAGLGLGPALVSTVIGETPTRPQIVEKWHVAALPEELLV